MILKKNHTDQIHQGNRVRSVGEDYVAPASGTEARDAKAVIAEKNQKVWADVDIVTTTTSNTKRGAE